LKGKSVVSQNQLHSSAQFALFITSYLPLFVLISLRQFGLNINYFSWAGINKTSLLVFASKFGLAFFLTLLSIFGFIGYLSTFKNLKHNSSNGFPVVIADLQNKNSESIGYIATYLIPFLFQRFDSLYEFFSVFFLLFIIYRIYINSNLLLINPVLSIWYSLYEIRFVENGIEKKGLIVSPSKDLEEKESIRLYSVGHKLFYAIRSNP
jgi:hypothetical protein